MKWPSRRLWHGWCRLVVLLMIGVRVCTSSLEAQTDSPAYQAALEALRPRMEVRAPAPPTERWDVRTAIPHLETALAGAEEPAEGAKINLLLGLLYMWDGQIDKAIQAHEVALAYDENMEADFPEQKIRRLNPTTGLGDCYQTKGDWATAIKWWEKALEVYPEANRLLAMVHFGRSKLGQAGTLPAGPMVVARGYYVRGPVRENNDRLLVPATEIAQRLSVVAKAGSPGQVELASDAHSLLLFAGSREAVFDGRTVAVPVAPVMVNGKMLVPLRLVAEAFGHRVDWEPLPRIAWVR